MSDKVIKRVLVTLIIVMILVGIVGGVLYFTTDMFKSNEVLFKKYISQNVKNIADVLDVSKEEGYIDLLRKNDYTENTYMTLKYLKSQNDQEETYNIRDDGLANRTENSLYRNIVATYDNETLLDVELLKLEDICGFRLANLVDQFVSVQNASIAYLVSSMGYEGEYFSERMNLDGVDISGLLDFSDEEIATLSNTYSDIIFSGLERKSFSSKGNALITLSNGTSVTTNSYKLTITQNDLDKIYKKVLNQAINDQIILSKIENIDNKIKELGFNEPTGKSLKERYTQKLQEIADSIEYTGADNRQIEFTVYQTKGITVRTSMKSESYEYIMDLDDRNGKAVNLKIITLTGEGTDTKTYLVGKSENTRTIQYSDAEKEIDINLEEKNTESQMNFITILNYKSSEIANIDIQANTTFTLGDKKSSQISLDENNNIILNDYEGDRIESILDALKKRQIDSLEESESRINTKLLNSILRFIDDREKQKEDEEQNNIEKQKERFNNKFTLYEGEDLTSEYIEKLLAVAGKNMSDYEVVNGKKIKLLIQEGVKNEEMANEIIEAISDRYTYDVKLNYAESGYIESIEISVNTKNN